MFLIKSRTGYRGAWETHEAKGPISHLGNNEVVEVRRRDFDLLKDERFPSASSMTIHVEEWVGLDGDTDSTAFVRWVLWQCPDVIGENHMLVTDQPIFICDEHSSTIEALR